MAISTSLRNRIVGFLIIASTVLIFLPVILSKDMMTRENNQAVAVDQNGAIKDKNGQLQIQSTPDLEQALALGDQSGTLTAPQVQKQPSAQQQNHLASNKKPDNAQPNQGVEILGAPSKNQNASIGNGVVMNDFSANTPAKKQESEAERAHEILTASRPAQKPAAAPAPVKPAPQVKPAAPKTEVLVANNAKKNPPATPAAPVAQKPIPQGVKVVAGTRPSESFVVQVGVFGKKENADNIVRKLKGAGISYYMVADSNGNRTLYRVYAGRSNNRNELNNLVPQINKLCGTQSKVVSL